MNQHQHEDLLVDALLDYGFSLDEALNLIALQERIERERRAEQRKQQREQWLDTDASDDWLN